jgi:hypothetical protein
MADNKFESFLEQYHAMLLGSADRYLAIMRDEITGIYGTVADDPRALKQWDEFLEFVDGPAPFKDKFKRYLDLKLRALGLSPEAMQ